MTSLNESKKRFPALRCSDLTAMLGLARPGSDDCSDTAAYARFKKQLKRAVDSVDAPEYLIDAIKASIRS
jgi:hypothetical protein